MELRECSAPSLEVFKARLDQPGIVEGVLPMAGEWNEVGFKVLSNPNQSGIPRFHVLCLNIEKMLLSPGFLAPAMTTQGSWLEWSCFYKP